MLKKTITYTDYNGMERTEDFWFNLTQAELLEMEVGTTGGFKEMIDRLIAAQDGASIIKIFKKIILQAYGEKSPDGKRFIKSEELCKAFSETEAYSNLFMELATNTESATAFINGIVPANADKNSTPTNEKPNSIGASIVPVLNNNDREA